MNDILKLVIIVIAAIAVFLGLANVNGPIQNINPKPRRRGKKKRKAKQRSFSGVFLTNTEDTVELDLSPKGNMISYAVQLHGVSEGEHVKSACFMAGSDILEDVTSMFYAGQGNGLTRSSEVIENLTSGRLSMLIETESGSKTCYFSSE